MTLDTDPRRRVFAAMAVLAGVEVLVALINLTPLIDRYAVGRVLDMNGEANAVAWLSSTLLLGIGLLAGFTAYLGRGAGRVRWAIIAGFFVLLSLDETASLHELAGELASRVAEVEWLPSLYMWVIVVAPFAAVFAIWMIRWIWGEFGPGSTEARMALVAVVLWLAVPVLEAVDPTLGGPRALIVVEESLEITGEILMLGALSLHLISRGFSIEATERR
jgi:hypothetical protein